jgi:Mg-chelatase subunit ChlD
MLAAVTGCANDARVPAMTDDAEQSCTSEACALPTSNFEVKPDEAIDVLPSGTNSEGTSEPAKVCASDVIEAALTPVNLFLMVDRSGSMSQNNKWNQAVGALRTFLKDPETEGLRVALRFFSDDEPMAGCTMQGCSVDACAEPLVQVGALAGETGSVDAQESKLVDALDHTFPRSGLGTPIYPALGGALQWASTYRTEHPNERSVVVLVTDGEPNGCNQDIGDISGLAAQAAANFAISTYAIGLEGSNEAQLDQIAQAGQTSRGIFVGANTNAESELVAALNTIRGQTMSCDFALPSATSGQAADPGRVNVTLTNDASSVELFRVDSEVDCVAGQAAWYYDDATAPNRIHLCPSACESAGQVADISVTMGCVESRREPQAVR